MFEYQYSFHRGELDFFAPMAHDPRPNCHRLVAVRPISRREFAQYCEAVRVRRPLTSTEIDTEESIRVMGAAW